MTKRFYAGVGSRRTPSAVLESMEEIARRLAALDYHLRSGAAPGADRAFEKGAGTAKQIFLPWRGFQGHSSVFFDAPPDAFEIAARFHPGWEHLSETAQKFMARNSMQVLGPRLDDPVDFVVCWTPDGAELADITCRTTGGTGQAIRIADEHNIPVFNLLWDTAEDRLWSYISTLRDS